MQQNEWTNFHADRIKSNYPLWPVEAMVKVLFGDYMSYKVDMTKISNVLDVGCGFGNNLMPFIVRGMNCKGVEISEDIAKHTSDILHERGFKNVEVKAGHNRSIPYESDSIDLLISNNVIHYEENEENYLAALKEYCRVLKKDGRAFFMTAGERHLIFQNSIPLGNNRYKIANYDFRDGSTYFYAGNEKNFKFYLDQFFNHVEVGRVHEKLMNVELDFVIAFCADKK
jgi:SAM-dependent methyltransferase